MPKTPKHRAGNQRHRKCPKCQKLKKANARLRKELHDLQLAVSEMRDCQREYLSTHCNVDLVAAKNAEAWVDSILRNG